MMGNQELGKEVMSDIEGVVELMVGTASRDGGNTSSDAGGGNIGTTLGPGVAWFCDAGGDTSILSDSTSS